MYWLEHTRHDEEPPHAEQTETGPSFHRPRLAVQHEERGTGARNGASIRTGDEEWQVPMPAEFCLPKATLGNRLPPPCPCGSGNLSFLHIPKTGGGSIELAAYQQAAIRWGKFKDILWHYNLSRFVLLREMETGREVVCQCGTDYHAATVLLAGSNWTTSSSLVCQTWKSAVRMVFRKQIVVRGGTSLPGAWVSLV